MARILIVDDEPQIRKILSVLLVERGHEVAIAETGELGLNTFEQFHPELVLLDLNLPGIDGIHVLQGLMEKDPRLHCVMLTAFGTIRSAVEAMRLGAFDYLTKPFDNDELLLVVERALERRRLTAEVEELRAELESRYGFSEIIGISPAMQHVFRIVARVAETDATVLIGGESGTGKELVARALHRRSRRADGPFVAVNCSAIPTTLFEAEFFGHEKGAFTDARQSRPGKFELASGGTLFLDEVGEIPLEAQAKLLRALEERTITRLGARSPIPIDVRVIAATHKDLERAVADGQFRDDLYWRLNVVGIQLPPLRERKPDIPLLLDHIIGRFNRELSLSVKAISQQARQLLIEYEWPGNVRELENTICQAMILCEGETLTVHDLPPRIRGESQVEAQAASGEVERLSLAEAVRQSTERLEKQLILSRLTESGGNRTQTAESLGISRKTLFNKMRSYGIASGEEETE
jgi:DNA-binding NtrC family response regulator